MFQVETGSAAKRFLKKVPSDVQDRILEKIESLRLDPFPHGVRGVLGRKEKTARVRVGDYRILYVVFGEQSKILIADIDKRSRAYD